MRKLIFILLAIIGVSQAQTIQYIGAPTTTVISRGNFRTDSIFYLPKRSKAPTDTAAIRYQISDSSVYVWTGSQWLKPATDTTSLSNRINLKLNISDTASMLSPYYRSATASAALALKLNISDTSTMLANYVRHAGYGLTKSGQAFLVDTAAMATRARVQKAVDSLQANINAKGSGTVTSVATGYGLSGGTITTTGTLLVDTLNIATRAWRQKGIDSVVSIIPAAGVGGSGTTNYVPKFTAASTLGNSQIFADANGVGIGITDPATYLTGGRQLVVANTSGAAGTTIRTSNTGDGSIFFSDGTTGDETYRGYVQYIHASDALRFGTSATERLRITSGGVVAVNTQTPDVGTILHTARGSSGTVATFGIQGLTINPRIRIDASETNNTVSFNTNYNGGTSPAITFLTSEVERLRIFANGRVFVGASPTDAGYQFDINGTLRSVNGANFATSSGNVGIGTASPAELLHVYRPSAGDVAALVANTVSSNYFLTRGSGNLELLTTSGSILFSPNATTRMTLNTASELIVATTSDAGDYKLQVAGATYQSSAAASQSVINTTNASGASNLYQQSGTNVGWVGNGSSSVIGGATSDFGINSQSALFFAIGGYRAATINSSSEFLISTASDAGDYKLQVAGNIYNTGSAVLNSVTIANNTPYITGSNISTASSLAIGSTAGFLSLNAANNIIQFNTNSAERGRINSAGEWIIDASGTDAGDYKLQVVGNARIGTGKLDIASNTTFGLGIARSGTSEIAGQIYNSSGILYTGVEGSAGGAIFTGSSAYAAVIGSGANYPLQFATNNATRATINTGGELLINTLSDQGDYKLQVNGSVYNTGQVTRGVLNVQGTGGQVFVDSTTNISSFAGFQTLSGSNTAAFLSGNVTWNTTGNANVIDIFVTNTASGANANFMQLGDGTNNFKVTKDASIMTANPTGGTARKWRLGSAATVSPTSPNRTIQIEVDGVIYYLHAKTTND